MLVLESLGQEFRFRLFSLNQAGIYLFKVNNNNTTTMSLALIWCLCFYLWTDFTHCSVVSIVNFEHVNVGSEFGKAVEQGSCSDKLIVFSVLPLYLIVCDFCHI